MRIVTLNLWHGLAPSVGYSFRSLEPKFRRRSREVLQEEWLSQLNADVVLLQEVNPVPNRMEDLMRASGRVGFCQPDLAGIKLKGFGWPYNLNSGLVTLTHPSLGARSLGGVQLSGSKGWARSWTSWQLSECRYALLVEFAHREWGRGLIVNTHLHHGLEFDGNLQKKVQKLLEDGSITPTAFADLRSRLETADQRRDEEIELLMARLESVKNRYGIILLGGDFNFSPVSAAYNRLKKSGFQDLWTVAGKSEVAAETFDCTRNAASHRFTSLYPMTIESEDLSFSPKVRDSLKRLLREHEARPRRIDYLWAMVGERELKIRDIQLDGIPSADGLSLSDHFAIVADLS